MIYCKLHMAAIQLISRVHVDIVRYNISALVVYTALLSNHRILTIELAWS